MDREKRCGPVWPRVTLILFWWFQEHNNIGSLPEGKELGQHQQENALEFLSQATNFLMITVKSISPPRDMLKGHSFGFPQRGIIDNSHPLIQQLNFFIYWQKHIIREWKMVGQLPHPSNIFRTVTPQGIFQQIDWSDWSTLTFTTLLTSTTLIGVRSLPIQQFPWMANNFAATSTHVTSILLTLLELSRDGLFKNIVNPAPHRICFYLCGNGENSVDCCVWGWMRRYRAE